MDQEFDKLLESLTAKAAEMALELKAARIRTSERDAEIEELRKQIFYLTDKISRAVGILSS